MKDAPSNFAPEGVFVVVVIIGEAAVVEDFAGEAAEVGAFVGETTVVEALVVEAVLTEAVVLVTIAGFDVVVSLSSFAVVSNMVVTVTFKDVVLSVVLLFVISLEASFEAEKINTTIKIIKIFIV